MFEYNNEITELLKKKLFVLGIDLDSAPWSVYAAVFSYDTKACEYELLSTGSGIKCLPDEILTVHLQDCLVHDMHAEVICKRAFVAFIHHQLIDLIINNNAYNKYLSFDEKKDKFIWNSELELIFYTSQSPCKKYLLILFTNYLGGDSSIFKSISLNTSEGKKRRIDNNIFLAAGRETDRLGILRTKPGRADCPFSSSMSCSDKLCLWNIVGLQGALLSQLVSPIYLTSIIIGDDFDLESSTRALVNRLSNFEFDEYFISKGFRNSTKTLIIQKANNLGLKTGKSDDASIFWYKGLPSIGTIILGFKKGSCRPKKDKPFGLPLQSPLSRQYIFEKMHKVLVPNSSESYIEEKILAKDYQRAKKLLFSHEVFQGWIVQNDAIKIFRDTL